MNGIRGGVRDTRSPKSVGCPFLHSQTNDSPKTTVLPVKSPLHSQHKIMSKKSTFKFSYEPQQKFSKYRYEYTLKGTVITTKKYTPQIYDSASQ